MMLHKNRITALVCALVALAGWQVNAAPITTNLELQLDAASGNVTKDGSNRVSSWNDLAGAANHATQTGADATKPIWSASLAPNSQPALDFNTGGGSSAQFLKAPGFSMMGTDVFIVGNLHDNRGNYGVFTADNNSTHDYLAGDTAIFWNSGFNGGNSSGADARWRGNSTGVVNINDSAFLNNWIVYNYTAAPESTQVRQSVRRDGFTASTGTTSVSLSNTPVNLAIAGRASSMTSPGAVSNFADVEIAEILAYTAPLTTMQRNIVENYLASKYDRMTLNDRYDGDSALNGNFDFDVMGIGNDSSSVVNVTETSAGRGLILQELNGSLDGGEFVFAGHKTAINGITDGHWDRSWYITKTGDVDVRLTFDISEADGIALDGTFVLLYREFETDAFAPLSVQSSGLIGDQIYFDLSSSLLQNGSYTLGAIVPEPSTWILLAGCVLPLISRRKRR